nr:TniB family NTP-binding protein [Paraburkholderia strydomiana]
MLRLLAPRRSRSQRDLGFPTAPASEAPVTLRSRVDSRSSGHEGDLLHDLLAGTYREQRASLNLVKFLANDVQISMVLVGPRDAVLALQTDSQMVSRYRPFEIPRLLKIVNSASGVHWSANAVR